MPKHNQNDITFFAKTNFRNQERVFGIKTDDRRRHMYVIGKTGMGKSTLLENMAVQDIQNGEGLAFIDPHGKTADLLLEYVPKERIKDVIYIAPFDTEYPISFNVLESVDPEKRHLVVSGLMSTFKKIWEDAWSARMEYILTNTLLALLECPGSTLLGVNRMLSDKEYRKLVVSQIQDVSVKTFWTKEFANYTERMAAEAVPAIQNKVGQFTANPLIRNMIGQPKSSFDIREAMDNRKILIINLSKGRIGDENMKLLGGLLVTKIYLAAMSRADVPDKIGRTLPNFYLFVDEFQNFANASFADILSEARKYKLNLTIAHQYIEQMDEQVSAAVFGNVGTTIAFRVGAADAEVLEKEFMPQFTIEDLINLGFAQIYLKLMIEGLTSPPFSAVTLPPIAQPEISHVNEIISASRSQFTRGRQAVEAEIFQFHEPIVVKKEVVKKEIVTEVKPVPTKAVELSKVPEKTVIKEKETKTVEKIVSVVVPIATTASAPKTVPKPPVTVAPSPRIKPASPVEKEAPIKAFNKADSSSDIKTAPLSSLISKRPSIGPKITSQENINELRKALEMAIKKEKTDIPASPKSANVSSASPNNTPHTTGSVSPAEVPEDVLKNVLKVE